jgi:hypothetical protein
MCTRPSMLPIAYPCHIVHESEKERKKGVGAKRGEGVERARARESTRARESASECEGDREGGRGGRAGVRAGGRASEELTGPATNVASLRLLSVARVLIRRSYRKASWYCINSAYGVSVVLEKMKAYCINSACGVSFISLDQDTFNPCSTRQPNRQAEQDLLADPGRQPGRLSLVSKTC